MTGHPLRSLLMWASKMRSLARLVHVEFLSHAFRHPHHTLVKIDNCSFLSLFFLYLSVLNFSRRGQNPCTSFFFFSFIFLLCPRPYQSRIPFVFSKDGTLLQEELQPHQDPPQSERRKSGIVQPRWLPLPVFAAYELYLVGEIDAITQARSSWLRISRPVRDCSGLFRVLPSSDMALR